MATTLNILLEAFDNSGRHGFKEWLIENKESLLAAEQQQLSDAFEAGLDCGRYDDTLDRGVNAPPNKQQYLLTLNEKK